MMAPSSLKQVARVTGGQLHGADVAVSAVSTDSRALRGGELFVALRGEHFDGHRFVEQAKAGGAAAALVEEAPQVEIPHALVEDTRLALGHVARANRRAFDGPVIAVSGSNGKTSCKEMLAAVLRQRGEVLATRGNLNNEIGVPLTLLELAPQHRFAVIEMGASGPGDIGYLCQFAEPAIAVLTNAQRAHLEGFGDLDGVARTKGEIYQSLPAQGRAVINADDPHCELWRQLAGHCRQWLFSLEQERADFHARDIELTAEGSRFVLIAPEGEVAVQLALPGRHMVANALAAAAAALAAGATLADIATGLASLRPIAGRLCPHSLGDYTLIDDSYNANPGSARAAVDVLAQLPGRRLLVMGQMAELGDGAAEAHRELGRYAAERGIARLFAVGPWADRLAAGFGPAAVAAEDRESLLDALRSERRAGDVVLIKGSRSAGMDELVDALLAADTDGNGGRRAC